MPSHLIVFHTRKDGGAFAGSGLPRDPQDAAVLELETCQRWIRVVARGNTKGFPTVTPSGGIEVFEGPSAYAFLLRVATGLESALPGETNILGQMRQGWLAHADRLRWLQSLFEDAKEIRRRHLVGLGSVSYGGLVRRALDDLRPSADRPVVLLGSGDLAHSVAPWLLHHPLRIWSRSGRRATDLVGRLNAKSGSSTKTLSDAELEDAMRHSAAVVACIPFDPANDEDRCRALLDATSPRVIHLGGPRRDAGAWGRLRDLACLDDLLARKADESAARSRGLTRARIACEERARLRCLGFPLGIAHGWEDLAVFADIREPSHLTTA